MSSTFTHLPIRCLREGRRYDNVVIMGIGMRSRGSTLGLVRTSLAKKPSGSVSGHIVTWDVDRRDRVTNGRLRRFVFGYALRAANGRRRDYEYEGFVHRDGVYYLGQSVLFVEPRRLRDLLGFLEKLAVAHHIRAADLA